jgi:hypothetical protein
MATVIKRQFRATPHRTASEAWQAMTNLIAPDKKLSARTELSLVAGVFEQIIASEAIKDSPIIVFGSGPRLRLYCLYDEDAITGEDANENSLSFTATEGDWQISVPCLVEDLEWAQRELKKHSKRISAREIGEPVDETNEETSSRAANVAVNEKAFLRS